MDRKKTSHVVAFEKAKAKPGEMVVEFLEGYIGEMMGSGDKAQHNGALIITTERVVFYRKGWFGEVFETIPLASVTSVEQKSLMGHRQMTLHTSHDELSFKTFEQAGQFDKAYEAVEQGRSKRAAPAAPPAPSVAPAADPLAQLKALAELHKSGVITTEEFETKKTALMARI
ncbi:SHOCT domain-containing protein [Myxococcus sp. Y35]|uniref:SHOCT domain-containing protein n=1 Tax=Pseudomyxococcus flavus TaxID=3115648 RepID=UPI003CF0E179